jgi:hypothetical protein
MRPSLPRLLAVAIAAASLWPGSAAAQVNTDVGLSGGAMKRFTTGAEAGDPGFGPVVQLQGHVAVLPMLRVGLYASWDNSPMSGYGSRNFYEGGLHLKFTPPLLSAPWHTYVYLGFGAGYVRQEGYSAPGGPLPGGSTPMVAYSSTDGVILEVPAGLGLAYTLGGAPGGRSRRWDLFFEAGGRFGVAFIGRTYDPFDTALAAEPGLGNDVGSVSGPFLGQDSFALTLSVGVSWSN